MSREAINERIVMEPERVPALHETTVFDMKYTCDDCGLSVIVEAHFDDGRWRTEGIPVEPLGWRDLSGFKWAESVYFCSFTCEVVWLKEGKWEPLVAEERARIRR